jgi:hypothetical protein
MTFHEEIEILTNISRFFQRLKCDCFCLNMKEPLDQSESHTYRFILFHSFISLTRSMACMDMPKY